MPDRRWVQVQHGPLYPLFICLLVLDIALLLFVQLLSSLHSYRPPSDNEHDIQQNIKKASAIVRTSAPRETPMAFKLSAAIVIVESERTPPSSSGSHPPLASRLRLSVSTQSPPKCHVRVRFYYAGLRLFRLRPW